MSKSSQTLSSYTRSLTKLVNQFQTADCCPELELTCNRATSGSWHSRSQNHPLVCNAGTSCALFPIISDGNLLVFRVPTPNSHIIQCHYHVVVTQTFFSQPLSPTRSRGEKWSRLILCQITISLLRFSISHYRNKRFCFVFFRRVRFHSFQLEDTE